jgi:hypothetical protein
VDPLTINGLINQIAATGPVAAIMLLVLIFLYRAYSAKESCKDPSGVDPKLPACNRCLACKDRHLTEKDDKILALGSELRVALELVGVSHLEAVKAQEQSHTEEVIKERSRNDALQDKNEQTLREIIAIFKGPHEE